MASEPLKARTIRLTCSLALSTIALIGVESYAHQGASGVVKERMESMKTMKEQMKLLGDMAKGKAPFDQQKIASGAGKIAELATTLTHRFPEGSMDMPTEALPAIWQKWDQFEDLANRLDLEATKLGALASQDSPKPARLQIVKLGRVCTSCHKDFRKKKDNN